MKIYSKVEQPAPVRVIVPYSKKSRRLQTVVDCLRIQQVQAELVKVDRGDAYWRLLNDAWSEGETFFIVEQDVLVWQGGIRALFDCEEPWCTFPTMCHGRMIETTFGAVKFSKELIEANPDFFSDIPTTWFHLDCTFADKMGWPEVQPHVHWPPATHLNEIQWADRISLRYTLERKIVWHSIENGGDPVVKVKFRVNDNPEEQVATAEVDSHGFEKEAV